MLPSCIFPKHQLSWSCRRRAPPAVGSMLLQSSYTERIAGPLRALRDSGPSLRGARGFTPLSRLSPPLSHAIGSVIMLGIAYERDASVRRPDHPVNGREVDDLMAGSRTPAAANCEAGARSAGYRRMSPTCAPRGAFGMRRAEHTTRLPYKRDAAGRAQMPHSTQCRSEWLA